MTHNKTFYYIYSKFQIIFVVNFIATHHFYIKISLDFLF